MNQAEVEAALRRDPLTSKSRTRLAIPFVGKDVPSPAAEFAQPDITIGLTIHAYKLQGLRTVDLTDVAKHLQKEMYDQSGPMQKRPASMLYNQWIREAGGEVCGTITASRAGTQKSMLQMDDAVLYVDARVPSSSSGQLGSYSWRDLSGKNHDIDVRPATMAQMGGHYVCAHPRFAQGSTSTVVDPAEPLQIKSTNELRKVLDAEFTVSIVARCTDDSAPWASFLAIQLGSIQIGAARSQNSLPVSVPGPEGDGSAAGAEVHNILYPPGMSNSRNETRLHQFSMELEAGDAHARRVLKYYVNGAFIGQVVLASHHELASPRRSSLRTSLKDVKDGTVSLNSLLQASARNRAAAITIGQARDAEGVEWTFGGSICLVLVHEKRLTPGAIQSMAASLMQSPEEWTAPRPGDGTIDGASLREEMESMHLDRTMLLLDCRRLTHARIIKDTLTRRGQQREESSGPSPMAIADMLQGSICTVTCVVQTEVWALGPLVLFSHFFFDQLGVKAGGKKLQDSVIEANGPGLVPKFIPHAHTLVIEAPLGGATHHSIRYFIDGRFVNQSSVSLADVPLSSKLPHGLAKPSRDEDPPLLGDVSDGASRCSTFFWIVHDRALEDFEVANMAHHLRGEQTYTRPWDWVVPPLMVLRKSIHFLSARGRAFLQYARMKRCEARRGSESRDIEQKLTPRVQPLFLLDAGERAESRGAEDMEEMSDGPKRIDVKVRFSIEGESKEVFFIWMHFGDEVPEWAFDQYNFYILFKMPTNDYFYSEGFESKGNGWFKVRRTFNFADRIQFQLTDNYSRYYNRGKTQYTARFETPDPEDEDCEELTDETFPVPDEIKPRQTAPSQETSGSMVVLLNLVRDSQPVIKYYLRDCVFPELLLFQKQKISASGGDLGGDLIFKRRLGFTGTPSDLLPASMGRCGFAKGAEGEMVQTLTSLTRMRPVLFGASMKDWTSLDILGMIISSDERLEQPLHALIDTGALITGMSNEEVAVHLIENGLPLDGVVFLGANDEKMIYEKRTKRSIQLSDSLIPLERRFCFYDQVHTTGTDIKHVPNAVAMLTLGKDMTFRDYAQGAYRMRGIATGQRINVIVVPEVVELMRRQLDSVPKNNLLQEMNEEERILEGIVCWLIINSLDSECKQFNFLMLQNLANVYRRHSLQAMLSTFREGGFSADTEAPLAHQLTSFHEKLSLDIAVELKAKTSFVEGWTAQRNEHSEFIVGDVAKQQVQRAFTRIMEMEFTSDDGGLAQEQEQEQEEEKEQESVERVDDQPVIHSDIAFARENEEPTPWRLGLLGLPSEAPEEVPSIMPTGVGGVEQPTPPWCYPASKFAIHLGTRLELPASVHVSSNWYNPHWQGPRKVKNAIVMLEWMPSVLGLSIQDESVAPGSEEYGAAKSLADGLWQTFANDGVLPPDAIAKIVSEVMQTTVADEVLTDILASSSEQGLRSAAELAELLTGPRFRKSRKGRQFMVISLREAETLRSILHMKAGTTFSGNTGMGFGLRLVGSGGLMLDSSWRFPDFLDAQLQTACEILRFIDQQVFYTNSGRQLLLRALGGTSACIDRELFHRQMALTHRREPTAVEHTPLSMVLTLPTEFELMHRSLPKLFLDMAMTAEMMSAKEVFTLLDKNSDSNIGPEELTAALRLLELPSDPEAASLWLQVIANGRESLTLQSFTQFVSEWVQTEGVGGAAGANATGSRASPHIERRSGQPKWRARVAFSELRRREYSPKALEDGAELRNFMQDKQKTLESTRATMAATLDATQQTLIQRYEEDEESIKGPNPHVEAGTIIYDFSRLNLPQYERSPP